MDDERRASDRRQSIDPNYDGAERRIYDRRIPDQPPDAGPAPCTLSDIDLIRAYERTRGQGVQAELVLAEIEKRGLDL